MQYKIIVDKQPMTNPSDEKKEYIIDIEELRVKGDVYDSLNIEMDRTYVTRRLSLSEYGVLSVLDEPVIEELPDLDIELFEGDNYIYLMDMQGNSFYAEYIIKNDFTDIYATKNEMNSAITQTAQSIELSVNQKLEGYSTTQEMNSAIQQTAQSITSSVNQTLINYATNDELEDEVTQLNSTITQTASEINSTVSQKVGKTEVISSINQSAEAVQINANKISLDGKQINLTSDDITISSTNFNVDKNGNLSCNNANFNGGKIILNGGTENSSNFQVLADGNTGSVRIIPTNIWVNGESNTTAGIDVNYHKTNGIYGVKLRSSSHGATLEVGNGKIANFFEVNGRDNFAKVSGPMYASSFENNSKEKIKKNITKLTKNATEIINNSDIYEYNLKKDKDTDRKLIGFVIGDNYRTPEEVLSKDGEAVRLYSITGILWKAVQELSSRVEQLEKEAQHEKDTV